MSCLRVTCGSCNESWTLALAGSPVVGDALGWLKLLNVLGGFLALAMLPWPSSSDSGARA